MNDKHFALFAGLAILTLCNPAADAAEVVVAAGDIAKCGNTNQEKTAQLIDRIPGTVLALGDNAYQRGTASEYSNCYHPGWGRFKARTKPTPGNHEYMTDDAQPYLTYFNKAKNYSFNLGAWHVVSLDSNCQLAVNGGSCGEASPTMQWLKADLAAHPSKCTLVFFHHPRWSSGIQHGSTVRMSTAWKTMYAAGVDVVLSGHAHDYERFAPLDPLGHIDWTKGIRSFVVGTGGSDLTGFGTPLTGSQVRNATAHGVLKLVLKDTGFSWNFVPVAGQTFTDSGFTPCH